MKVISTVKYLGLVGKSTTPSSSPTTSSTTRKRHHLRLPPRRTKSNDDIFDSKHYNNDTRDRDFVAYDRDNSNSKKPNDGDEEDGDDTSSSGPSSLFLLSRQLSADDLFHMDRVTVDAALESLSTDPIRPTLPVRHYKSLGDIDKLNDNKNYNRDDNVQQQQIDIKQGEQHQEQQKQQPLLRRALSNRSRKAGSSSSGRANSGGSRRRIIQRGNSMPQQPVQAERRGAIVKNVGLEGRNNSPNQIQRKKRNETRSKQLVETTEQTKNDVYEIYHGRGINLCENTTTSNRNNNTKVASSAKTKQLSL